MTKNITDYEREYELDLCEKCFQMTNHLNGVCQKCKEPEEVEEPKHHRDN